MTQPDPAALRDHIPLLWSLASRLLGWRPVDFWQSTPAELAAAIRDPETTSTPSAPSRDLITQMLERDSHG